jgi:hypothetical protein
MLILFFFSESGIPMLRRKLIRSLEKQAREEILFTTNMVRISSVVFGSALVNFLWREGSEGMEKLEEMNQWLNHLSFLGPFRSIRSIYIVC